MKRNGPLVYRRKYVGRWYGSGGSPDHSQASLLMLCPIEKRSQARSQQPAHRIPRSAALNQSLLQPSCSRAHRLGAKPFPTEAPLINVASRRSTATALPALSLDRRARNGSERAKHTTIAGLRPKDGTAALALIEIQAGVGWHRFGRLEAADRTGNR